VRATGHAWRFWSRPTDIVTQRRAFSATSRRWDVEVGADLADERDVDLEVALDRGRALGVEAQKR
jgi:hypothetical protein